jgi:hypothetical protein
MAIIFKKKSKSVFANPSYIKDGSLNNKIDKIINETIKDKLFNTLGIDKKIYIRLVEYFPVYTLCKQTKEKAVNVYMMRIKTDINPRYIKLPAREIEISGVNLTEFESFLDENGAVVISDQSKIEFILTQI